MSVEVKGMKGKEKKVSGFIDSCKGGIYMRFISLVLAASMMINSVGLGIASVNTVVTPAVTAQDGKIEAGASAMAKSAAFERELFFEANQGQTDAAVKFLARGKGYSLFLTPQEAVLALQKPADSKAQDVVRMSLQGSNTNPAVKGLDMLLSKSNYMTGDKWHTNVEQYSKVEYKQVYTGIDMVYYGNQGQLEYDFVVAPGANPGLIRMDFLGARNIELDKQGNLILNLKEGKLTFNAPVLYQKTGDTKEPVEGRFLLAGNTQVCFEVGSYDKNKELIIDPTLTYATYLGTTVEDRVNAIAVDASGNVYMTGQTAAVADKFPGGLAISRYQASNGGGAFDAFVIKINAAGAIVWTTYYGGVADDIGLGIGIDSTGKAYITGSTTGVLPVPYDQLGTGGGTDAFIAAFSADGTALVYAKQFGGPQVDSGNGIAVDAAGNAYVTGGTLSMAANSFPYTFSGGVVYTVGAAQTTAGGAGDGFVSKFNSAGVLMYSTYLGGTGIDQANAIAIDSLGNAYVTGQCGDAFVDVTLYPNAFHNTIYGASDAFMAKLDPTGANFLYKTYVGGAGLESGDGIALDSLNNIYITGWTGSADFPKAGFVPIGQTTNGGGPADAFVFKMRAANTGNGDGLYSTYIGGGAIDRGTAIKVDASFNAYVVGETTSGDFESVSPGSQNTGTAVDIVKGGTSDGFLAVIATDGINPRLMNTFIGGVTDEKASGVGLDASNNIYVAGWTDSTDFPTAVPLYPANTGSKDGFVVKISPVVALPEITNVNPNFGRLAGGTTVLISGTGFTGVIVSSGVQFGGVNASTYTVISSTQITAISPAHSAGTIDIKVTTLSGASFAVAADTYSYYNLPAIITGFSIVTGTATINEGARTIAVVMPSGTNVTALSPAISITGFSVSPASGTARNFTNPVTYTVTAVDASTRTYIVTVTVSANSAKDITAFNITGGATIIGANTIAVTMPFGINVSSLIPTITITGASVNPVSNAGQNFSTPKIYTVTAVDSSTKTYTVTVTVSANSAKDITAFNIPGGTTIIGANTIAVTMPFGTNVTALVPAITITGDSVSPLSGAARNFTSPVTYTVSAADSSTKIYTVTVTVAANAAKDITGFAIPGGTTIIGANTIAVTVPFGTNVTGLLPTITITGASVSPVSGAARDFTNPVTYTVTATDSSTKIYTVTVTVAANSAKDITGYTIPGGATTIGANTIAVTMPFGTNVTALVPTITITGDSVSPASGAARDFTNSVAYTVTAADASTKIYTVTVTVAPSSVKEITGFNIPGGTTIIGANTIALTMPYGTDVTGLLPTITIVGASVSPVSGAVKDFTNPVAYTVTAADASTKIYTVTVTVAANSAKDITALSIPGGTTIIGANTIAVTMPYGTNPTALIPTIATTGDSISPINGAVQNFTNPVTYTVTAADATTKTYTVTVTVALNFAKDITALSIPGGTTIIGANTIAVTMPFGTNVTALLPTITMTGASVSPVSGAVKDFTNPVTYTVTAADSTTKIYTVTVTPALNFAKDITGFSIPGGTTIMGANTIAVVMPYGTNVTALIPTITMTGASVSPINGAVQDFTSPITYTVTAADSTTKTYTVTVTLAANSAKNITGFSIPGATTIIGANTVAVTMPFGTNVTALIPTITMTGASISPINGAVQNFTAPISYTVTAADATTKTYTVTVTVAANTAKDITGFTIPGATTIIGANTIALTMPFGTNVTALIPTLTITGASVSPINGAVQNFTNPVTYTVTAANASTKVYTVTVTLAANTAKDITVFTIPGATTIIGANTIALTVPFGTDVTGLLPTITFTGASVSPASGISQIFTTPITYVVTAADGSTKTYTVTVTVAPNSVKDITAFTIPGGTSIIGVNTISVIMPFGSNVTALIPTIANTGASVSPINGAVQNFTTPVTYTVTAADATTKSYTVTVMLAANSAKNITGFTIPGGTTIIGANTIAVTMPYGTNVTGLLPTITFTGVSVSPITGAVQNFTAPKIYTVTAADATTKTYTVTVTVVANFAKDITSLSIPGGTTIIGANTIAVTMPYGTNVTGLLPTITFTGASVAPFSGAVRNFTVPVIYTVTAADNTTKTYTVTVTVALNSAKDLTVFTIPGATTVIGANTIAVTLPFGTDVTGLLPMMTYTGASVSPINGATQDFTAPVTYTVTAADSSTKIYTVTVTLAANTAKDITVFNISGGTTLIGADTVAVTVPYGTNVTGLLPTITITGAAVSPITGAVQDFTNPVIYTVTAADNTTKTYTVTVIVAPLPAITGITGLTTLNPILGPSAGGTTVVITGFGFTGITAANGVTFVVVNDDGVTVAVENATSYTVDSDTRITAISPPHAAGKVYIVVTSMAGSSPIGLASRFTYFLAPDSVFEPYIFPSPVEGNTADITYFMDEAGVVKIRVYNEIADLVAELEESKSAGAQISRINTGKLAPGVYFYLLNREYAGRTDKQSKRKFVVIH